MLFKIPRDDLDMLQSFVEEAADYLQRIEEALLALENSTERTDSLNEVFRQMHTVKGLSSFFGITDITRLSHEAEFMLDALRNGRLDISSRVLALLLDSLDVLVEMVGQLGVVCQESHPEEWVVKELKSSKDLNFLIGEIQEVIKNYGLLKVRPEEQKICLKEGIDTKEINNPDLSGTSPGISIPMLKEKVGEGMLEEFLEEADEHMAIISDKLLLDLDSRPEDVSTLQELFRRVHSLKGNIALLLSVQNSESKLKLLMEELLTVFQEVEELLAWVRNQGIPVPSEVTDLCFSAMESLRKGIIFVQEKGSSKPLDLQTLLHTLKSTRERLESREVQMESESPPLPKSTVKTVFKPEAETPTIHVSQSVRVSEEKLNRLMNVIGELMITKNVFGLIARRLIIEHNLPSVSRDVKEAGLGVTRISEELEDIIMSMRMTAVRQVFQKFPRIVRDIALKTGKNISLIMEGEETELDKTIIEQIADPLMHLVRNSADHGIESEKDRIAAGKEAQGRVWLRAYNRGKHVYIEIEDDGKGMDPQVLKRKAIDKGFISEVQAAEMSEESAFQLVFLPGFSTAGTVSEISGRGVGMDVVKSNVNALQGKVHIVSQLGRGTKMMLQLPLTLLVSRGLVVEINRQFYIFPLENVLETLKVSENQLVTRKGKRLLHHRSEVLGIISLAKVLGVPDQRNRVGEERKPIVVLQDGGMKIGMMVDRLHHEQDILVKPLPDYLSGIPGMGGATIMTDGKVAIVLNAVELIAKACLQNNQNSMEE